MIFTLVVIVIVFIVFMWDSSDSEKRIDPEGKAQDNPEKNIK